MTRKFEQFSTQYGTAELLMNLALGRVQENPNSEKDIQNLKEDVIDELERAGLELKREENDRRDVPIDFRYLDLPLKGGGRPRSRIGRVLTRSPCRTFGQDAAPPSTLQTEEKVEVSGTDRQLELPRGRSILAGVKLAFQLPVAE